MLLLLGITLTRNDLVIRLILSTDKTIDVHDFFFYRHSFLHSLPFRSKF